MQYTTNPPLWNVTLSHDELVQAQSAADFAALAAPNPITEAVAAGIGLWRLIDRIGGNNGISLTGTIGEPGILPLPANFAFYASLVAVLNALPAGVPAAIGAILTCNPILGFVALVQGLGGVFGPSAGDVRVDQGGIGDNEPMVLIRNDDGTVSFLSHVGYLSLDNDPGHNHNNLGNTVHARATAITDAEKWYLEQHPGYPGAVALKSKLNNCYLIDWINHGDRMSAEAAAPGISESFILDFINQGKCVLRAPQDPNFTTTKYVSIAG